MSDRVTDILNKSAVGERLTENDARALFAAPPGRLHEIGAAAHAMRRRLQMPERYGSCHTGLVAGYVIEGHVPAREIHRLLAEKPQAIGLAVPGMPVGSPGMDAPIYGDRKDPHDVLLVLRDGNARVFQSYFRT